MRGARHLGTALSTNSTEDSMDPRYKEQHTMMWSLEWVIMQNLHFSEQSDVYSSGKTLKICAHDNQQLVASIRDRCVKHSLPGSI